MSAETKSGLQGKSVAVGEETALTQEPLAAGEKEKMTIPQIILAGLGFLSFGIGVVGIFVPLLPATEFIILAAFLFAKSSPRFHRWVLQTKVYNTYVRPFKEKGGLPKKAKIQMVATSLVVLAISAALVRIWYVWLVLAIAAAAILYVVLIRTPTRPEE